MLKIHANSSSSKSQHTWSSGRLKGNARVDPGLSCLGPVCCWVTVSSIHLHSWGPIQSSSLQACGKCVFLATELWLLWDRQLGIYGNRSFKYPKHCSMDRRSSFLKGSRARHLFWGWNESTIGLWRKPHLEKMDGVHSVQVWWFVRPWEYKATVSSFGSLWFFSPLN